LLAAFVLSSLLTQAGSATASAGAPAAPGHAAAPAPLPPSLDALLTARSEPTTPSWPALIEARLAELDPVRSDATVLPDKRLRMRIEAALAGLPADARVAIEVRDLDDGALLYAHDPQRPLNPASNQKLITAIAAVELLGPDYRFETSVWRQGDALIIRGEGDPDLHMRDLHQLVDELVRAPEQLAGVARILVDDSAFDRQLLGPGFRSDGPGDSYVAPSSALALDYATVAITVVPGEYGQAAQVHLEPASPLIDVRDHSVTGSGELQIDTRAGELGRTIVEISGAIPGGHAPVTVRRRVNDPGLIAGTAFAQLLADRLGGEPLPVSRGRVEADAERLASHESASLLSVLASALRHSNNFTAEQVLRTLAWRASGQPGSWAAGVDLLDRFAAAVSPEHAPDQQFANGSGLTLDGRASPHFLLDVLALTTRPGSPAHVLLASFAAAGGEGTLRNRLPHAGAHVLAKTGTYAGASTLSGIVQDQQRTLGFSILINGAPLERSRASQDRIVAALLRAL
jgi:D-alanyl-D-alanine carboxypeptidase/D-alanyl-D-alanine-endopeptidase (penicillin-binding protein 4)